MWQTNVFPSAQRRKMRSFEGFKRRAVVVVVGDEEQTKRLALHEAQDGKDVPESAVLEMKGISMILSNVLLRFKFYVLSLQPFPITPSCF